MSNKNMGQEELITKQTQPAQSENINNNLNKIEFFQISPREMPPRKKRDRSPPHRKESSSSLEEGDKNDPITLSSETSDSSDEETKQKKKEIDERKKGLVKEYKTFRLQRKRSIFKRKIKDIMKRMKKEIAELKKKARYDTESEDEYQLEDTQKTEIKTETPQIKMEPTGNKEDTRNSQFHEAFEEDVGGNKTFRDEIGQEERIGTNREEQKNTMYKWCQ